MTSKPPLGVRILIIKGSKMIDQSRKLSLFSDEQIEEFRQGNFMGEQISKLSIIDLIQVAMYHEKEKERLNSEILELFEKL